MNSQFKKAAHCFSQVCTLYNRWKAGKRNFLKTADRENKVDLEELKMHRDISIIDDQLEFGVDDYIKVRASLAESLMSLG